MKAYKVCVLGGGAFGTSMAQTAASNVYIKKVSIYARSQSQVDDINNQHKNTKFFPQHELSSKIQATTNVADALEDSTYVLSCIPVQSVRPFLKQNKSLFNKNVPFVSCSKGIVLETGQLISEVVKEELGSDINYAALSGPSFAEELMKKFPTVVVIASENEKTSKMIQLGLQGSYFRMYIQKDVVGVELAGALKNILAIGAGFIQGSGYGYNTTTAFLARGVREMQIFANHYGAEKHTFYGLAGIGDLMLTSFGGLSRNRQFGIRIGQGESLNQIIESSKGVVEGVPTLEIVRKKSLELDLDMPLTYTIYDGVKGTINKEEILRRLMTRSVDLEFPPTFEDLI